MSPPAPPPGSAPARRQPPAGWEWSGSQWVARPVDQAAPQRAGSWWLWGPACLLALGVLLAATALLAVATGRTPATGSQTTCDELEPGVGVIALAALGAQPVCGVVTAVLGGIGRRSRFVVLGLLQVTATIPLALALIVEEQCPLLPW